MCKFNPESLQSRLLVQTNINHAGNSLWCVKIEKYKHPKRKKVCHPTNAHIRICHLQINVPTKQNVNINYTKLIPRVKRSIQFLFFILQCIRSWQHPLLCIGVRNKQYEVRKAEKHNHCFKKERILLWWMNDQVKYVKKKRAHI